MDLATTECDERRPQLLAALEPFDGRSIDDELIQEMMVALNNELASVLEGRRIRLLRESWGIRVELAQAPQADTPSPESRADASLAGLEAVKAALAA